MKPQTAFSIMAALLCAFAAADPTEYFVNCYRTDDSGDGKSEATAFRTIKHAIETAQAGDIITVLPGEYGDDQGTPETRDGQQNRVVIGKNITLRSRDGAAATHIVGKWANTATGMGEDGVRCIDTYSACTVKGFTIRDGSSNYAGGGNDQSANRGGGILASGKTAVFTDCVISNCVGTRGGGACRGTYIRCKFLCNFASNYGSAMRDAAAFNCLFAGNASTSSSTPGTIAYPGAIVNCTIVNNKDYGVNTMGNGFFGPIVNSVILYNKSGAGTGLTWSAITNCVTDHDTITSSGYNCLKVDPGYELYSPAGYDYRLMPDGSGVGHGDLSAARDWYGDYMEETDLAGDPCYNKDSGTMNVGAFQSTGPSGASALGLSIDVSKGRFFVNGNPVFQSQPYRTAEYPHSLCVGFQGNGTHGIICYTRSDTKEVQWPTENDEVWMIMPKTGNVSTALHTGTFKYVDQSNAGDAAADGTAAHPYPNIIDATTNITADTVIMVADGEYREGCKYDGGLTNRVWLGGAYWKRLRSVNGAGRTFIFGAPGSGADGIGTDAVRCVFADGYSLVQGFTLLDGHTNEGSDSDGMRGGGMYSSLNIYSNGTYHDQFIGIADCVISNCVASRGTAIFGGSAYRCLITKNRAVNNGVTRNCVLYASLVTGNEDTADKGVIGVLSTLCQTTVADNSAASGIVRFQAGGGGWHANTVVASVVAGTRGGVDLYENSRAYVTNSVIGTSANGKTSAMSADTIIGDPGLCNMANGDFRIVLSNPAAKLGDPAYFRTALDFTGRPYKFDASGRYPVGAFAETVGGFAVAATNAVGAGISPKGFICCTEVSNVTFTATEKTTRHFLGFDVNGVLHADDGTGTIALQAGPADDIRVTAVYDSNWYVDDVNGDDANTGFSWENAKKTLAAAAALMCPGDTLNVAPGVYRDGTMLQGYTSCSLSTLAWTPYVRARLVVTNGCSVVSRDGPETTFIMGEADNEENGGGLGLGPNAVRGVFLGPNTRLSGFTVTGGRTAAGNEDVNTSAGGIAGYDYSSLVENCIISNNVSQRGGGMRWGACRNCRFLENTAALSIGNTSCARNVKAYTCLFDNNKGEPVTADCHLYNCTIGAGNTTADGGKLGKMTWTLVTKSGYPFVNTILAAPATKIEAACMTNCAYAGDVILETYSPNTFSVETVNPAVGEIRLDGLGRPQKGSVAIDAGDVSLLPEPISDTDLAGNQRIYNNAIDIGCYEYDARDDFARTLKPNGGIEVTSASPDVEQTADGILIHDGELAADWTRSTSRGACVFDCAVTGGGLLTVLLNGETFAGLTSADGPRTLEFRNALTANALTFRYAAADGDTDTDGALVSKMAWRLGTVIGIR